MLAHQTGLVDWDCPECGIPNSIFLVEGESLPDELDCSFCEHESGKITWENYGIYRRT